MNLASSLKQQDSEISQSSRTDREASADICFMLLQHFGHDKLPSFILNKKSLGDIVVLGQK